jgi:hypothetical protein
LLIFKILSALFIDKHEKILAISKKREIGSTTTPKSLSETVS